jgi:CRP-like cAMP-binding protein
MLSETARGELLSLGTTREYLPDSVLILEGDSSTDVMALIDGWVKVVGATEGGGQALLSLRVGGDLVGELAALDNEPRSATVISAGVTAAQVVSQRDFLQLMGRHPEVGVAVSRALTGELRWATRRRVDFSGLPVMARLARVLSELGYLYGKQTPDGIEFQYTLTQPELAAMVGASEPSVHKALRQLRHDGAVSTGYRQVVITDPAALDAIASSRSSLRVTTRETRALEPLNNGRNARPPCTVDHMDDKPYGIRRLCAAYGVVSSLIDALATALAAFSARSFAPSRPWSKAALRVLLEPQAPSEVRRILGRPADCRAGRDAAQEPAGHGTGRRGHVSGHRHFSTSDVLTERLARMPWPSASTRPVATSIPSRAALCIASRMDFADSYRSVTYNSLAFWVSSCWHPPRAARSLKVPFGSRMLSFLGAAPAVGRGLPHGRRRPGAGAGRPGSRAAGRGRPGPSR